MKVLVVGGAGRTGGQVVRKLGERGEDVRVLSRRGAISEGAELVQGSVTDEDDVRLAVAGMEAVVVVVESADSDDAPNSPERVHYRGIRNVIDAVEDAHIVLVTQIYITRPEAYPEVGNVIYWRGEGERALRESGLSYTVVRPSWLTDDPDGKQGCGSSKATVARDRSPARMWPRRASKLSYILKRGVRRSSSTMSLEPRPMTGNVFSAG